VRRAALALLLFGAACTRVPRVGEPAPEAPDSNAESDYKKVLDKYSAHAEIYNSLDTRIFAAATLQSDAFVTARLTRQGQFQQIPAETVNARIEAERQRLAATREFFLGVHANNSKFDDFDKADSIWRIALVTAEGEVIPEKIDRVGRATIDLRSYYPYMDDFWVGYLVRFPKGAPGGTLKLKMASSLGRAEMQFPGE
jgi:hypothetical protein